LVLFNLARTRPCGRRLRRRRSRSETAPTVHLLRRHQQNLLFRFVLSE
jgi:hypothetical protein